MTKDELKGRNKNNFAHHAPFGNQVARYEMIRHAAKELSDLLVDNCPVSRELSLALTDIENAVMWANASIARNENQ